MAENGWTVVNEASPSGWTRVEETQIPGMERLGALPKAGQPPTPPQGDTMLPTRLGGRGVGPDFYTAGKIQNSLNEAGTGVQELGAGKKASGATKIIHGVGGAVGQAALPFVAPAAVVAPGAVAGGAVGSYVGGKVGKVGAKMVNASPDTQGLFGELGSQAGGVIGAMAGPETATLRELFQQMSDYKHGLANPELYPPPGANQVGRSGQVGGPTPPASVTSINSHDISHILAHPTTGVPVAAVKILGRGRFSAGSRALAAGVARRNPTSGVVSYPEGMGPFGSLAPPEEVRPTPGQPRPAPGWEGNPTPMAPPLPEATPIPGALPSGRRPGPAPESAPPNTELSPEDPGAAIRYREEPTPSSPLPTPQEAGFGPNPPQAVPPLPNPHEAVARAKKAAKTAQALQQVITPDKVALLQDPEVPTELKDSVWSAVEKATGKPHSPATRAQVLTKLSELHQDQAQTTPLTSLPTPPGQPRVLGILQQALGRESPQSLARIPTGSGVGISDLQRQLPGLNAEELEALERAQQVIIRRGDPRIIQRMGGGGIPLSDGSVATGVSLRPRL